MVLQLRKERIAPAETEAAQAMTHFLFFGHFEESKVFCRAVFSETCLTNRSDMLVWPAGAEYFESLFYLFMDYSGDSRGLCCSREICRGAASRFGFYPPSGND